MKWEAIKMDLKERFLNFETAKGVYMAPAGAAITYAAIFHIAFVIQVAFGLLGWYIFSEGLRKIWVNRVKQELKRDQMKATRLADSGEPTTSIKAPAPEATV